MDLLVPVLFFFFADIMINAIIVNVIIKIISVVSELFMMLFPEGYHGFVFDGAT